MHIQDIRIKNFKSLKDVHLTNVPKFTVLVGANGSGKSTFFDIFGFLRDCLKNNVRQALQVRGGFREVVSREQENEPILIELKAKVNLIDRERVVTYGVEIRLEKGQPIVANEYLRYRRGGTGQPFYFLKFSNGEGEAIVDEENFASDLELKRETQRLDSPDILAIKGLGQFQRFLAASQFRSLIENWHVSDFHISAARGSKDAGYAEHLSPEGDNLPLVTQFLYESHPTIFGRILDKMKRRVPGVAGVTAETMADGRLVLRFQDGSFKDPFVSRFVSDGTIKMFAYLVLLNDPTPHPLLCVEEPENQLYPTLLPHLAEEFAEYSARGGQVFVSTHSPDFLNHVDLENIYWLHKTKGFTSVRRANQEQQLVKFAEAGDHPGDLWKQGLFEGADPK
ncbi:MAG TPA: chromosome segregation protein SMC [Alphaproteobacteria bacterium]|nr:chromosome segregation protein SMC [Alphaproteobacteria bacterium]